MCPNDDGYLFEACGSWRCDDTLGGIAALRATRGTLVVIMPSGRSEIRATSTHLAGGSPLQGLRGNRKSELVQQLVLGL